MIVFKLFKYLKGMFFFYLFAFVGYVSSSAIGSPSVYLQKPILCEKCAPSDISIVLPDSFIDYKYVPKGITFQRSPSFTTRNEQCNTHGVNILNEMADIIPSRYLNVTNVPVFSCGSTQNSTLATSAFKWIKEHIVLPNIKARRKTIIAYAWGTIYEQELINAVQEIINLGVLFIQSAGNSGIDTCSLHKTKGVMYTGSTLTYDSKSKKFLTGDKKCPTSNRGQCVKLFGPGWIFNVITKTYDGCGTSWPPGLYAMQAACYWQTNLNASAQQIMAVQVADATVITPVDPRDPPYWVQLKSTFCKIRKI